LSQRPSGVSLFIAPTTTIDVLIPRSADQLELWPMRWGLIPSWWTKSLKELPSTFNARAETVTGQADVSRCQA